MQPKRVLVALAGTSADPDLIRLVASIAKAAKAQVVGIHVIEVRWNLPLARSWTRGSGAAKSPPRTARRSANHWGATSGPNCSRRAKQPPATATRAGSRNATAAAGATP